mgnify:CR=1 FL=1
MLKLTLLDFLHTARYKKEMSEKENATGHQDGGNASPAFDALEAIASLLAAAADMIEGLDILRRRGPTRFRRWESALAYLMDIMLVAATRHRAVAFSCSTITDSSKAMRHLRRPAQGWAAP